MKDKFKPLFHIIALAVFIVGSVWSIQEILNANLIFNYYYLVIILLVAAPISLLLSISRFQILARLYGGRFTFVESANVVILGGLANLLPIPGALLVRLAAIRTKVGSKKSVLANAIGVGLWLIACLLVLSFAFFWELDTNYDAALFVLSILLLFVLTMFLRYTNGSIKYFLQLCLVQIPLTVVNTLRLWLLCLSIGYVVDLILPASVSLASILVSGASITPGGIGVAELMSSSIAHQLNYPASVGFIMLSGNRLITWIWFSLALLVIRKLDIDQKVTKSV